MRTYKYALGITSQLAFCSVPFRLDSYSACQFSCTYCFAKARGGHRGSGTFASVNVQALRQRLNRVTAGVINSAVDEFFDRRIPIQIGGMTDPFPSVEAKVGVTRAVLELLGEYDYPFLLSTSSSLKSLVEPAAFLNGRNGYIRFSVVGAAQDLRARLQRTDGNYWSQLRAIEALRARGVAVGVRIQPIVPGHEEAVCALASELSDVGVSDVTLEYLKLPLESSGDIYLRLQRVLPSEVFELYRRPDAQVVGRERTLPLAYRAAGLKKIKAVFNSQGFVVGLGDNEFMLLGDTSSCCNSASRYLRNATFFTHNVPGVVRAANKGALILFDDVRSHWSPSTNVGTYMNSRSRLRDFGGRWSDFFGDIWNSGALYGPTFFGGIVAEAARDRFGNRMFRFVEDQWLPAG